MAHTLDPKELVTFEELLIANMYEYAALIELLDRKGLVKKQQILDMIQELHRKTPKAQPLQGPFPEPYLPTEAENALPQTTHCSMCPILLDGVPLLS